MIPRRSFFALPMLTSPLLAGFGARLSAEETLASPDPRETGADTSATIYVRAGGSDIAGDGASPETAFATPQRAVDNLPELLDRSVTIDVGPGIYSTSSREPSSMHRPAVIYLDRLRSGRRTAQEGKGLSGSLVFRLDPNATIQAGKNGFPYGIYCTGDSGSIAIWGGKVEAGGPCNTLITAHRGTYVHLRKMQIDGSDGAAIGLLAEGGGFLECIETDAFGSKVDLQTYSGSFAQMAAPNSRREVGRVAIGAGSMASLFMGMRITQSLTNRGVCELNGGADSRVSLEGSYDGRSSQLHAIRTDFRTRDENAVVARCDSWETGDFAFDCVLNLYGGNYNLAGSRAFVAGQQSPHPKPIRAIEGTFIFRDAGIDWTNNQGVKSGVFFIHQTVSVSRDAFTIPVSFNSGTSALVKLVNQTGQIRRSCVLDDIAATTNGHHPDVGSELTVIHMGGEGIEIVHPREAVEASKQERVVLGRGPGMTSSARFVWLEAPAGGQWLWLR